MKKGFTNLLMLVVLIVFIGISGWCALDIMKINNAKDTEIARLNKALAEKKYAEEFVTKTAEPSPEENTAVIAWTETYEINVRDCPLRETIEAGKYDWVNPYILERFQSEPIIAGKKEVFVICFNRHISSEDAVKEMAKMNLHPANIWDQLALGEKYPDLQRKFPIIALDSSCEFAGRRVPFLSEYGSDRRLSLDYWDSVWSAHCRFLAVRN